MITFFGKKNKESSSARTSSDSDTWILRLKAGLKRSSDKLVDGLSSLFTHRTIDEHTLDELEELLISADLGPSTAHRLVSSLRKKKLGKDVTYEQIRHMLANDILTILSSVTPPLEVDPHNRPHVILIVGVNGTGKTTTIGKLAYGLRCDGQSVMMVAGDLFRSGAIEQLRVWGQRAGCTVFSKEVGDAAGLAYEALKDSHEKEIDVLLIDTAGRLHNKSHLMAELKKIKNVIQKIDPTAPHSCLLILDATTGQNALSQVETFREVIDITGLIVTKLDGSARGGIIVALAEKFGLPIHAIGVGEQIDDLVPFSAQTFANSLIGETSSFRSDH